jgi:phosphoenolpyruvate carboxykinase (ATP)
MWTREELTNISLDRGEGVLASNGALTVRTGNRTGRSPKDRFIVKDEITKNTVDWNNINQFMDPDTFNKLWNETEEYLSKKETFSLDLFVGSDSTYQVPIHITCELAWHALFARNLFIENGSSTQLPWTILSAPNLKVDGNAYIILNFTKRQLLVIGTHYAGEIKKGMFSALNFLLPPLKVLPMHCSANQDKDGTVALFFGLSGTGKTTLSADPDRYLIGDDEHGWSSQGVFNFEGGCYAKCINLSKQNEPLIWNALRSGTVMENVVLDDFTGDPNYDDDSLTQNTRAAYDLSYIENCVTDERSNIPKHVIFLSCDMYGVLPPVARLTSEQAAYYFLSGYTALVGSTEVGSTAAIKPTFSTCFGAPFFPRKPSEYADLLMEHLHESDARVYLVNTGWTAGPYSKGKRFSIPTTRNVIRDILDDTLDKANYKIMSRFGFEIPEGEFYDPINSWENREEYHQYTDKLIQEFQSNFEKFNVPHIEKAGPA